MLSQSEINLVFRVLDANFNRAVEGLRAAEEYFRFIASNTNITAEIKELRHRLTSACSEFIDQWANQRDSQEDVGSRISASDEYSRLNFEDIVGANLARVSQALRSMEEYSKAVHPHLAQHIESTRYDFYEAEKNAKRFVFVRRSLDDKNVYVLTSACPSLSEFEGRIKGLCAANADVIQLREKNIDDSDLLERAKRAVEICSGFKTLFVVNDRPDIALMSDADGVHVGQEEIPIADIRKMLPANMLIGVSAHSLEQAQSAEKAGADYIGVGPTFPSKTKCFTEFKGTELLQSVAESISIPAFAIGGINMENISLVAKAGFNRVAVSNVIHSSSDPKQTIQAIRNSLVNSPTSSS